MRTTVRGAGVALALLLLLPALASAGTLTQTGPRAFAYAAASGEINDTDARVHFIDNSSYRGWAVVLTDRDPIAKPPSCQNGTYPDDDGGAANEVICFESTADAANPPSLSIDTGDGNDRIYVRGGDGGPVSPRATGLVTGGPGNDRLQSASGAYALDGGDGDDELRPDDVFGSSTVPDVLSPNAITGGPGRDKVLYNDQTGSVTVTLDGQPDDGVADGDNVAPDVEDVQGSFSGANRIVGTDGPNVLDGGAGNDTISGGGGNDTLRGDDQNDTLDGGDGDDVLEGGAQDDQLTGGPGTDSFAGDFSGATNQIVTGNDTVNAVDGLKEPISCGPGADVANADAIDDVTSDPQNGCETVNRTGAAPAPPAPPAGPPAPAPAPAAGTTKPGLVLRSTSLLLRDGRIAVKVTCAGTATCRGSLSLRRGSTTVATASYALSGGRVASVRMKLTKAGKRSLRGRSKTKVTLRILPRGAKRPITKRLNLRR